MLKGWFDLAFGVVRVRLVFDHCDSRGHTMVLYDIHGDISSNRGCVKVLKRTSLNAMAMIHPGENTSSRLGNLVASRTCFIHRTASTRRRKIERRAAM